ncbi:MULTISPECIES: hypothetical protein [Bacillaceae]|uniref:hypothetical protein n=1 Tax=Bacillaceae TaxID=186817 RepID=UPI0010529FCE|nr:MULTISPECIES: hypothetical protein [Bacillaceae]MDT2046250.1 hypothetical protein [Priestia flexa]TDB50062.1 hypothetical protein EPL02_13390 [Bacillus sp. CBEL-1]
MNELNGYLLAMEHVNHYTNHVCTFVFDQIPRLETIEQSIKEYFQEEYVDHALCLEYEPRLTDALYDWFFAREDECKERYRIALPERDNRVEGFLQLLFKLIDEANVNVYEIEGNDYWHAHGQYFVFDAKDVLYVLELGADS